MLFDSLPDSRTKPFDTQMIYGFDRNPMAIDIARDNAKRAGVGDFIQFEVLNIQRLERLEDIKNGFIVSNPPYGERLGEAEEVIRLYSEIGVLLKEKFTGFSFTIVCGNKALLGNLKLKEDKSLNLNIAKLKAKFVKYSLN